MALVVDPLRRCHHVLALEQAPFGSDARSSLVAVFPFCIERCLSGPPPAAAKALEEPWQEQALHTVVPDPVSPGQPEQEADSHVPENAAKALLSPVTPARQPGGK